MTNQELIDRSFMLLRMIESSDSANATDSADAMSVLNEMMAEWAISSRDFNFFPQDTLSATVPLPEWAIASVIANLAVMCAPVFDAEVTADVYGKADAGKKVITRTLMNLALEPAEMTHLPQGSLTTIHILTDT